MAIKAYVTYLNAFVNVQLICSIRVGLILLFTWHAPVPSKQEQCTTQSLYVLGYTSALTSFL